MSGEHAMALEPLVRLQVEVGAPLELGAIDGCARRFVPIIGGRVSGAFNGSVLSGGGDWQLQRADGTLEVEARYALEVGSARIEVHSLGLRCGSREVLARLARAELVASHEYYFRTAIRFRTGAPDLHYLNDLLTISVGERRAGCVQLLIYRVP